MSLEPFCNIRHSWLIYIASLKMIISFDPRTKNCHMLTYSEFRQVTCSTRVSAAAGKDGKLEKQTKPHLLGRYLKGERDIMKRPWMALLFVMMIPGTHGFAQVRSLGDSVLQQEEYWEASDWYLSGLALNSAGMYQEAAEAFRMSLSIEPRNPLSWLNFGTDLALMGEYQEAIRALEHSVRLSPQLTMGYSNLGEIYFRTGSFRKSIEIFGILLELQPQDGNALYKRGLSFLLLGEVTNALTEYALLRGVDPVLAGRLLQAIDSKKDP